MGNALFPVSIMLSICVILADSPQTVGLRAGANGSSLACSSGPAVWTMLLSLSKSQTWVLSRYMTYDQPLSLKVMMYLKAKAL